MLVLVSVGSEGGGRMQNTQDKAMVQLVAFFDRNGYVRLKNMERYRIEGFARYKKGDEIRLVANSTEELIVIRSLLKEAGFTMGRPFAKDNQFRQPVYGRNQVARFLAAVEENREKPPS